VGVSVAQWRASAGWQEW